MSKSKEVTKRHIDSAVLSWSEDGAENASDGGQDQ